MNEGHGTKGRQDLSAGGPDAMKNLETLPTPACRRFMLEYGPKRPGIRRALALSLLFVALVCTGLYLEFLAGRNWNAGEAVLLVHLALGLIFTALFLSWIGGHVLRGLPRSQRPAFSVLSWLLLAKFVLVVVTGLMMTLPTVVYLAGGLWFWSFEATHVLTFLHLWASLAAAAGFLVHLGMRHWVLRVDRQKRCLS
ncbi:DUF4405 domain-containing protein [Shinella sp. HZN7]|uniref:DUF4405 domain-containing protein n=1 Tax=Shinella sp. (strain HZN7) TaxID=879274 RepID=UPI0011AB2EA4|nr:DUF4405 domain-containing protein [Shinella sp. HZN7]